MEYIILDNQQNTYPNVNNYKKTALDTITLTGNFNVNTLDFPLPTLDDIIIVPQTNFRFILSIDEKLYTSPLYYNELVTAYNESNPYFIQSTFQPEFIVNYTSDDIASIISNLKVIEASKNINVTKNVFVLTDGSYDYIELVKYIDWVVSPIGLAELETNGVLSSKQISSYDLPEIPKPTSSIINPSTVEVIEENIQAYQYEYIRKRNLDREPIAVRETQNTTSRELYRIKEGNKFVGKSIGNGLFEVFDDNRSARVGYIKVSNDFASRRIKQLSGPFNIKILTIKKPTDTLDTPTNFTTPTNISNNNESTNNINPNNPRNIIRKRLGLDINL
jgi:hypothetical protein